MKAITKLLLAMMFLSFHSNAIVMRHDKESSLYQVNQNKYPSVINLEFLMGTLISPQWIVTAAHGTSLMPGGQRMTINGQNYTVEQIIRHPDYNPNEKPMEHQQDHDIALLKLNKPVVGVKTTSIYVPRDEQSQMVWFVGDGYIGNGLKGITGRAKSINHAQNIIDETDDNWLFFDFDSPNNGALALEGVSGPGDSGGPAFINSPVGLLVAGISSHQLDNDEGIPSVYGVTEKYTRVSSYASWIQATMKKTDQQLAKAALNHPKYSKQPANAHEKNELLGRYEVDNLPTFIIETCQQTLCYRWEGQPRLTEIFKSQDNLWFTPKINRAFEVVRDQTGNIEKLFFKGYQGNKYAIKR
jgi:hypothetical protein